MLDENAVVTAVCRHLRAHGWAIEQARETEERGIDIVARHRGARINLLVEAKGATSSKVGTAKYGRAFSRGQCRTHLAVALLAAVKLINDREWGRNRRVALALPDHQPHVELVAEIAPSLLELGIGVFWVRSSKKVRLEAPWKL